MDKTAELPDPAFCFYGQSAILIFAPLSISTYQEKSPAISFLAHFWCLSQHLRFIILVCKQRRLRLFPCRVKFMWMVTVHEGLQAQISLWSAEAAEECAQLIYLTERAAQSNYPTWHTAAVLLALLNGKKQCWPLALIGVICPSQLGQLATR